MIYSFSHVYFKQWADATPPNTCSAGSELKSLSWGIVFHVSSSWNNFCSGQCVQRQKKVTKHNGSWHCEELNHLVIFISLPVSRLLSGSSTFLCRCCGLQRFFLLLLNIQLYSIHLHVHLKPGLLASFLRTPVHITRLWLTWPREIQKYLYLYLSIDTFI